MFANTKSIILIVALVLSSQYSYAENTLEQETKNEPQHSWYAKCLSGLIPGLMIGLVGKVLYDAWEKVKEARFQQGSDSGDDQPDQPDQQRSKTNPKTSPTLAIDAVNQGGCMSTLMTRAPVIFHDLSNDPDVAERVKQIQLTKIAIKKSLAPQKKAKKQNSPKVVNEPKKPKATPERVSDCKVSKAVPASNRSMRATEFQKVASVAVEGNAILDAIVGQADENNVLLSSKPRVTIDGVVYEIELISQDANEAVINLHTIERNCRSTSQRVIVYWL